MSQWQDTELDGSPESSLEGREGTEEKSVQCRELDEEDMGDQNSCPHGAVRLLPGWPCLKKLM